MIDSLLDETRELNEAFNTVGSVTMGAGSSSHSLSVLAGKWVKFYPAAAATLMRGNVTVTDKLGIVMAASTTYLVWVPEGTTHLSTYSAAGGALRYVYKA